MFAFGGGTRFCWVAQATPSPQRGLLHWRWSDALLAACLVGVAVLGVVAGDGDSSAGDLNPSTWWEWLLVVSPSVPVAFRRSHTTQATIVSVTTQLVVWVIGLSSPFLAPLVLIYTAATETSVRSRRLAIGASAALVLTTLLGVLTAPDVTLDLLLVTALTCVCAIVLGVNVADQRSAASRLATDLAVADMERSVVQERAAVAERQRVARELHDIVGHSLSVIAVRSEAAKRVGPSDPSVAIEAAEASGVIARTALADVRRVLSGLREDDADVELGPAASLEDLPALIAATEKVGVTINMVEPIPEAGSVGAALAVSAYRIVQEALTNVIRHAGSQPVVDLRVVIEGPSLILEIDDDGSGNLALLDSEHGTGLTGMRERVAVLGGTLQTGPQSRQGFGVRAVLPLQTSGATT